MQKFTVAAIQMGIVPGDSRRNLDKADRLAREAARRGAQVVCLPELFNTGYDYSVITRRAGALFTEGVDRLKSLAREEGIYLVAGSMAERVGDRLYNTCVVIGPSGDIKGKYRKIHLFPPLDEPKFFTPGGECPVVGTSLGVWGLMLCYDLRFAELAAGLGLEGAQVIFVPAQFPDPRQHHWQVLLQARAIENQLYVVGVNRCGSDPQYSYFGNSLVVDPRGEVLASLGREEEILSATIDLGQNQLVREGIYYLGDRKPNLYYYSK
jgi:predicted amidohydrolase